MEFSTQLDHMEKLLIAAGMNSPTTTPSPFPAAHLNVALCHQQLNDLKKPRPEDIVMRQALELYCSLISPPSSPTSNLTPGYQPQQEDLLVTTTHSFHSERECKAPTSVEPTTSTLDMSKEYHKSFRNDYQRDFYHAPQSRNDYTYSTVSSASDQDISDSDDMDDDPFASYPLSCSNRLAAYSHTGYNSRANLRSSSGTSTLYGSSTHSAQNQGLPPFIQTPAAQHYGNGLMSKTSGKVMSKASSVDRQYNGSHLAASQGAQFNLNVQPTSDLKPSSRKRAFSVASFGKHRKVLSAGSAALRITGSTSPRGSNSSSSSGTFPAQAQTSGQRRSLLGCLSPAMEETEDITSFKIPPSLLARSSTSSTHARFSTSSSIEHYQPMNISNKFSSRSESKSIWKTFTS